VLKGGEPVRKQLDTPAPGSRIGSVSGAFKAGFAATLYLEGNFCGDELDVFYG
jgi:hypothetical protein